MLQLIQDKFFKILRVKCQKERTDFSKFNLLNIKQIYKFEALKYNFPHLLRTFKEKISINSTRHATIRTPLLQKTISQQVHTYTSTAIFNRLPIYIKNNIEIDKTGIWKNILSSWIKNYS